MVVLKRLSDAVSDRDNILAVIRGSAVNQDGRSSGMTAPNGLAQEAVIRNALKNGMINPSLVGYVEAHGTGTSLGDPIEVQALGAVLGANRSSDQRLMIGSVKTNLGHLEAAAGVAGLMKAILILQHRQIPPHLHLETLNPYIPWNELPIDVPTQTTTLPSHEGRYIVGVSSFGFSGTNSHIVLEAAPASAEEEPKSERPLHILKLSARNALALQSLVLRYEEHLSSEPVRLADLCFTANTGRADLNQRLAIVVSSLEDMRAKLAAYQKGKSRDDIFHGTVSDTASPEVVFLFTGHGSQYAQMSRRLFEGQPVYCAALTECMNLLKKFIDVSLFDILFKDEDFEMAGQDDIRTARSLRGGICPGKVMDFMGHKANYGTRSQRGRVCCSLYFWCLQSRRWPEAGLCPRATYGFTAASWRNGSDLC